MRTNRDEWEANRPCYVVGPKTVTYEDDWCYGKARVLGSSLGEDADVREMIKRDIRANMAERNGLPLFYVSDHGNCARSRAITLRAAAPAPAAPQVWP